MTARHGGHRPTLKPPRTAPGTPPPGPAGASSTNPALPDGPCILYIPRTGNPVPIDETAVTSPRDRALCRALLGRAVTVLDDAEAQQPKHPVGFAAPRDDAPGDAPS